MLDLQALTFRLGQRLVIGDFAHEFCDCRAEYVTKLIHRGGGVFDRVVQERSGEYLHILNPAFIGEHVRQGNRMVDVGRSFGILAALRAMPLR